MTGTFYNALISMGIEGNIAQIVCEQFQKVEEHGQQMQRLMSNVTELTRQVGGLQSALQSVTQQVTQIVDSGTTQAAGIATCVAKVQVVERSLQGLQVQVEHVAQQVQDASQAATQQTMQRNSSNLPTSVKLEKPKPYNGSVEDASILEAFLYACELFFNLSNITDPCCQAKMALLWLEQDAAVWWQTIKHQHPLDHLTWGVLRGLLEQQFRLVDAARRARDAWAQCTQGKGSVRSYVDLFRRRLLHVHDAAPAEVLDRFIRGLQASIRAQVLVADPQTFERAALLAERVAGAHGEAARSGPTPMDLGAVHGNATGNSNNPGTGGSLANSYGRTQGTQSNRQQGTSGQRLCHYCKQPGHFMLSCRKLEHDMQARRQRHQGGNHQGARANPFQGLPVEEPMLQPARAEQGNQDGQ